LGNAKPNLFVRTLLAGGQSQHAIERTEADDASKQRHHADGAQPVPGVDAPANKAETEDETKGTIRGRDVWFHGWLVVIGVGATSSGRLGAMQIPEGHGSVGQGRSALITMMAASIRKKVLVDKSDFIIFTFVD
jgi:hypothetical protein